MSRQTAIIIGVAVVVVIAAVAGAVGVVLSQQGRVVGGSAISAGPTTLATQTAMPARAPTNVAQRTSPPAPTSAPADTAEPTGAAASPTTLAAIVLPTTTPVALAIPTQILPARTSASAEAPNSEDSRGNVTTFVAANAVDGQPDTAWRVPGDGAEAWLLLEFAQPIDLRELQLIPGYAKVDERDGTDRFFQNRRVRRVRLEFSASPSVEATLEDSPALQPIPLSGIRTDFVRIIILESLPPASADGREYTPVSEVVVLGVAQ